MASATWQKQEMGYTSHNTTTHQDDLKQKKKRKDIKHAVQVNIREGLVPDARRWIADFQCQN